MAIYNREDARTALPQLEKRLDHILDYREIHPNFDQCSKGGYSCCYKIGRIVFLAFNFNITTATSSHDYITGLPPAIHNWGASATPTGSVNTTRWYVTTKGTLQADGATVTGWQNGSVVYIAKE